MRRSEPFGQHRVRFHVWAWRDERVLAPTIGVSLAFLPWPVLTIDLLVGGFGVGWT